MKELKPALLFFVLFTVICGGIYPAIVTGIAQAIFPEQANGSFISDKSGKPVGSTLIGQPFSDSKYFWPRPSATTDFAYNPMASGGSNSGPTNPEFIRTVGERVKTFRNTGISGPIPAELVMASASGLDPHITPQATLLQIPRVAKARGLDPSELVRLVTERSEGRQLGFLGEQRVNILVLNLELDRLRP